METLSPYLGWRRSPESNWNSALFYRGDHGHSWELRSAGMLLGHRYLTAPGMPLAPLFLNNALGVAGLLRLAVSGWMLVPLAAAHGSPGHVARAGLARRRVRPPGGVVHGSPDSALQEHAVGDRRAIRGSDPDVSGRTVGRPAGTGGSRTVLKDNNEPLESRNQRSRRSQRVPMPSDHPPAQTSPETAPPDQMQMAFERTYLAHERQILMAWVRTGTSLVTFGFSLNKFLITPRRSRFIGSRSTFSDRNPWEC